MSRDQFQIPQNVDFKIFSPNTNRVVHLASDGKIILYDQTNQNTNDAGNMKVSTTDVLRFGTQGSELFLVAI